MFPLPKTHFDEFGSKKVSSNIISKYPSQNSSNLDKKLNNKHSVSRGKIKGFP